MRRPAAFAPLSVTFATGKTGTAIQDKHGLEGLAAWACMIAAAKRGRGQIVFAHDRDWQAIGVLRPPETLALRDLLKTTGQLKQTRTTRQGHVMYVQMTQFEQWNNEHYRERERERKSSKDEESNRNKTGRLAEWKRKQSAAELELEERGTYVPLSQEHAHARAPANGSRAHAETDNPADTNVCPDCEIGGGYHLAECPRAQPTDEVIPE